MTYFARARPGTSLSVQCCLAMSSLAVLYAMPPVSGRMLLMPMTQDGRAGLARVAVAHGARLIAAGPWAGTLVVEGRRDALARPLFMAGVLAIAADAGGCGDLG